MIWQKLSIRMQKMRRRRPEPEFMETKTTLAVLLWETFNGAKQMPWGSWEDSPRNQGLSSSMMDKTWIREVLFLSFLHFLHRISSGFNTAVKTSWWLLIYAQSLSAEDYCDGSLSSMRNEASEWANMSNRLGSVVVSQIFRDDIDSSQPLKFQCGASLRALPDEKRWSIPHLSIRCSDVWIVASILKTKLSNDQNPGFLLCIGEYTTQFLWGLQ